MFTGLLLSQLGLLFIQLRVSHYIGGLLQKTSVIVGPLKMNLARTSMWAFIGWILEVGSWKSEYPMCCFVNRHGDILFVT